LSAFSFKGNFRNIVATFAVSKDMKN